MRGRIAALALGITLLSASAAKAAVLIDPYDNFLAPDGFYGLVYGSVTRDTQFNSPSGENVADTDFTLTYGILRPLGYFHVGRVAFAMQALIPFGKVEEKDVFEEESSGLGDITLGPGVFLYANEKAGTYVSYWLYITAPTGEWDKDNAINFGGHHWYYQHQLAYFQQIRKFVLDLNLNYYWHVEEPENDVKLPRRFEYAVSLAYPVTEKFFVGAHAGGYWDLRNVEIDGKEVEDTTARKFAAGPTLTYQITEKLGSSFRWTHDFSAANDFKGNDFWLRLGYTF